MAGVSAIAGCGALEVVGVVKTLLRGLGAEGEGWDLVMMASRGVLTCAIPFLHPGLECSAPEGRAG